MLDAELRRRPEPVLEKLACSVLESSVTGLHADALAGVMQLVTARKPSEKLLGIVLEKAAGLGDFAATVLSRWGVSYPAELLQLVEQLPSEKVAKRALVHSLSSPWAIKLLDQRVLDKIFLAYSAQKRGRI